MKTRPNVKLLREIKNAILEEPRRLSMDTWMGKAYNFLPNKDKAPCGTVACIAGHAVLINKLNEAGKTFNARRFVLALVNQYDSFELGCDYVEDKAVELLCLTKDQADRLFHVESWPNEFKEAYREDTRSDKKLAELTAQRIEHFIATKK